MRRRAGLAAVVLVSVLAGGVALGAFDGAWGIGSPDGGDLRERWLSETGVPVTGNHHGVTAGRVDGRGLVFVPVSGEHGTDQCRLVALEAADGAGRWHHQVPPEDCWIHSVGTLALADYDGDGEAEVIAPTAEERLYALDPLDGERLLAHRLSAYGYGQAAVGPLADVEGDGGRRAIVVVDAEGTVFAIRPDGRTAWTHRGNSSVWAGAVVGDHDGDGRAELVVGFGDGVVRGFEPGGRTAWSRPLPDEGRLTWLAAADPEDATGETSGDATGVPTLFPATDAGVVYGLHGGDGSMAWSRDLGSFAAVHAAGDGDGDGGLEVYAVANDGVLRALSASTGETEWETALPGGPAQFVAPPAMGDVDGDGDPELVSVTNGGTVTVHDPVDGSTLATYERSRPFWDLDEPVPVWERPTLADTDGDGADEVYVTYGDGRVAALEYAGP